ncbi:MAG: carbon storage regulator [Planctomycetaceae bacterium]|nr:carbon storage regulator [Planctomycetaceae bacterium]
MLALTRKKGESIILRFPGGFEAVVTLIEVYRGQKARLGIDAHQEIEVIREELLELTNQGEVDADTVDGGAAGRVERVPGSDR